MKISITSKHADTSSFRTKKSKQQYQKSSGSSKIDIKTSYFLSFCRIDYSRFFSVVIEQESKKSDLSGREETKLISIDDLILSKNMEDKMIGMILKEAVLKYEDRYFLMNANDVTGVVLESMVETGNCFKVINGKRVRVETLHELRPSRNEDVELEEILTRPMPVLEKTRLTVDSNFKALLKLGYKPGTNIDAIQLLMKYGDFKVNPVPNSSDGAVLTGSQKMIRETEFEKATIQKLEKQGLLKAVKKEGRTKKRGSEMYFVLPPDASCHFTKFYGLLLPSVEGEIAQEQTKNKRKSYKLAKAV